MDLSTPSDVYSQPDLDTFWTLVTDAGWDPSNVCSAITIHTHSHSNAGNMPGIEVGDVEYAGGKIVLKDFATTRQGTWEWRLVWDRVAGSGSTTNTEVGACVEKLADNPSTDDDHWRIFIPCQGAGSSGEVVDNVVQLVRSLEGQVAVADFPLPFEFEIRPQP